MKAPNSTSSSISSALEIVYNTPILLFSKIVDYFCLSFMLIVAPIMIYVILTKSVKMKTYRWYLIYLICWSVLDSIVLALFSPSLLSPYLCILINSPFEGYLDKNHWYTILEVFVFGSANLIGGMVASFLYRFFHLLGHYKIARAMDRWQLMACVFIMLQIVTFTFIYMFVERRRSLAVDENNYVEIFVELQDRKFFCLGSIDDTSTSFVYILTLMGVIIAFIVCILTIILSIIPIFYLRESQTQVHINTYMLQLKLYKAVLLQLNIMLILIELPVLLIPLFILLKIPHVSVVSQLILTLLMVHGPIDLFVVGYFIPSHRKYFVQTINRFRNVPYLEPVFAFSIRMS